MEIPKQMRKRYKIAGQFPMRKGILPCICVSIKMIFTENYRKVYPEEWLQQMLSQLCSVCCAQICRCDVKYGSASGLAFLV